MNRGRQNEQGFTVVEVIVTLVVTSLFLAIFFQMFMVIETQRTQSARRAAASDVAYSNLRKIESREVIKTAVSAADCSSVVSSNPNNLTINATAAGSDITAMITPENLTNASLPSTSVQRVVAFYPQGCGVNMPVKIVSSVRYPATYSTEETVSHATYLK